jgi:hypothetical protein
MRGAAVAAALSIAMLAVPSLACATVGDAGAPEVIAGPPWSQQETGTTVAVTENGETRYEYYYSVRLIKGQTYVFNCQMQFGLPDSPAAAPDESGMLMLSPILSPPGVVVSDSAYSASRSRLKFMAPVTRYYLLSLQSSRAATFSLEATTSYRVWFNMTDLVVPKSVKKGRSFKTSVNVYGRYNSLGSPITFQIQRKVGRRWATYATARSSVPDIAEVAETHTPFASSIKLKRKGTYRIRACFSDAANAPRYTTYKTVKVK